MKYDRVDSDYETCRYVTHFPSPCVIFVIFLVNLFLYIYIHGVYIFLRSSLTHLLVDDVLFLLSFL